MTDTYGTGTPASPAQPTTVVDPVESTIPPVAERTAPAPSPHRALDDITPERPRSHPIAYAALVVAVLALILSLAAMADDGGADYRQVKIGTNDCVIGQQGDTDVLYCRTAAVP